MPVSLPSVSPIEPILDHTAILTLDELAGRLKVKPTWIYESLRRRDKDPLPAYRCGRYLRFYWPHVSDWLRRHTGRHSGKAVR